MKISRVDVRAFGSLSDCSLDFFPGMNVIVGDNETGKSTVYRALAHTLLTRTDLDKRRLSKELGPFFPRPDGNAIECTLELDDGACVLRRRWGADAQEEFKTPDGNLVRGAGPVTEALERFLPVTPATLRTVFLADQSQLDQTIGELTEHPEARDEAAAALRRIRLSAGGVSPDLFRRLLDERIEALLGRWDIERDAPESGRDHRNPWTRGAGELVKACYRVQELEERYAETAAAENALDAARQELETAAGRAREFDAFVQRHQAAHRELSASRSLDSEIARLEERITHLRAANRAWPVTERDALEHARAVESASSRRRGLEEQLLAARERDEQRKLSEKLARVDALLLRREAACAERDALILADPVAIKELSDVERRLPYAEAKLTTGQMRLSITSDRDREVTIQRDGEAAEELPVGDTRPARVAASRRVRLQSDGMTIEVETGDEPFDELLRERDSLVERQKGLKTKLKAGNAAEAQAAAEARRAVNQRVQELTTALLDELGEEDADRIAAAREQLAARLGPSNETADRSQDEINADLMEVREEIAKLQERKRQADAELAELKSAYGSQDRLENDLGETNRMLAELQKKQEGRAAVPEGFDSVDAFVTAFERAVEEKRAVDEAHSDARATYAELVGRQPEQTSEEVDREKAEAEERFARVHRDADALLLVRTRSERIREELDAAVFDPFNERVAGFIGAMTDNAYVAHSGDDPLAPFEYQRGNGPALSYDLLSQGTKDSLALAVRLALAQTVLTDDDAPLILDDPFVDMDPIRRAAAAAVVERFAQMNQVILFTCHPDHATLFPDAAKIELTTLQK